MSSFSTVLVLIISPFYFSLLLFFLSLVSFIVTSSSGPFSLASSCLVSSCNLSLLFLSRQVSLSACLMFSLLVSFSPFAALSHEVSSCLIILCCLSVPLMFLFSHYVMFVQWAYMHLVYLKRYAVQGKRIVIMFVPFSFVVIYTFPLTHTNILLHAFFLLLFISLSLFLCVCVCVGVHCWAEKQS